VSKKSAGPLLRLGDLPVGTINATLHLELESGPVIFSSAAQTHAYKQHPSDFPRCLPFIGSVVANPLYLGDDFLNDGKIELISRIPAIGSPLLVALALERDALGRYHVASLYPISEKKIAKRLETRTIFPAKK
jgi:hypothetical protein